MFVSMYVYVYSGQYRLGGTARNYPLKNIFKIIIKTLLGSTQLFLFVVGTMDLLKTDFIRRYLLNRIHKFQQDSEGCFIRDDRSC